MSRRSKPRGNPLECLLADDPFEAWDKVGEEDEWADFCVSKTAAPNVKRMIRVHP